MYKSEELLYLLLLTQIKGLGPVSARNLIAYCGGDAKTVFTTPKHKLARIPGIGPRMLAALQSSQSLKNAERELLLCEKHDISILSYLEAAYPQELKYVYDAPLLLFKKGNLDLNQQINVAVVGTRRASDYGKEITEKVVEMLTLHKINIISGLAYGIDIVAHKTALREGGYTAGILGHGLGFLYPSSHRAKALEMIEKGGALLTEYSYHTKPEMPHFPARNRIISGLCKAVIVVEAGEKGGALITARQAFDQNKEVYAIPGRVGDKLSLGCNKLIQQNIAKLLTDPREIIEDLEIAWNNLGTSPPAKQLEMDLSLHLTKEEALIMEYLEQGDALLDQICIHTQIPISQLNALLLGMEFRGLIKQKPGKLFSRR